MANGNELSYLAGTVGALQKQVGILWTGKEGTRSVREFGAKGGTADDTTPIQAALNSGERWIVFPDPSYKITSPLSIPNSIMLSGRGQYTTRLVFYGCSGLVIDPGLSNVIFNNMEIQAAVRYTAAPNAYKGVTISGTAASRDQNFIFRDVFFDGFETAIEATYLWQSHFENVHAQFGHTGLSLYDLSVNNTLLGCKFFLDGTAGSIGLELGDGTNHSEGVIIDTCVIYGAEIGIQGKAFTAANIANCTIDTIVSRGIVITKSAAECSYAWNVANNFIGMMAGATIGASVYNDIVDANYIGQRIIGNTILGYGAGGSQGILFDGAEANYNTALGNLVKNFTTPILNNGGAGNVVEHNTGI
jgi:hypothetical protein